tara:strand:- start:710 stop:883 length:174 start_codon:yes stop_codon:yes gene_type:complete
MLTRYDNWLTNDQADTEHYESCEVMLAPDCEEVECTCAQLEDEARDLAIEMKLEGKE